MPTSLRDVDIAKHPLNFVVNAGHRDSYTDEKYQNLIDFFTKFHAVSSLSYTILDLDADPAFLFDIIDRFQLLSRSIRVGVALPIYKGGNQYVGKEDYRELGKFFVRFAGMASRSNMV